jgi:predicted transcriptional regulator
MPKNEQRWRLLEMMILSDQLAADELHKLLSEDPEFATWFEARAQVRLKSAKKSCVNT